MAAIEDARIMANTQSCWICTSPHMVFDKASDIVGELNSNAFAITDSDYGKTGELYRCTDCGFLQCSDIDNVLSYYEHLEDEEYEAGRVERGIQARKLLDTVRHFKASGTLVDIGAGSGILVEQAQHLGYDALGIEPSRWLQKRAEMRHLPVIAGTFPHAAVPSAVDVITLIDVIEHIPNPIDMLSAIRAGLSDSGIGVVVTPDVGSVMARLLRKRWWHFRFAHIGYFNKATLLLALHRAGLEPIYIRRPGWYFSADYLLERCNRYLPRALRIPVARAWRRLLIPLNLRDSLLVVFRKMSRRQEL